MLQCHRLLAWLEAVIYGIFGHHGWFSFLFNGLLAWLFAYVLYWSVCCNGKPGTCSGPHRDTLLHGLQRLHGVVGAQVHPACRPLLQGHHGAARGLRFILYMAATRRIPIPADAFML